MEDVVENIAEVAQTSIWSNILVFACIVVATMVVSYLVTRFLKRLLMYENSPLPASSILVNLARAVIWVCGLSILFSTCFGFDLSAVIAALGVGGLALSLGMQDTISNLIGGLQVTLAGTVKPGSFVTVSGYTGVVHDVSWRYTRVETLAGEMVVVPNSSINSSTVVQLPPMEYVRVQFHADSAGHDIEELRAGILNAVSQKVDGFVVSPEENIPRVVFTGVTEFAFAGVLVMKIEDGQKYLQARDQAISAMAPYMRTR